MVRQPELFKPFRLGPVTSGYFGYLATAAWCDYFVCWQLACFGGHSGSGPPSWAGTCWTEAAINVPTSPTVRIAILIARFMGSSPISAQIAHTEGAFSRGRAL
jgi:hypothetical protein